MGGDEEIVWEGGKIHLDLICGIEFDLEIIL
jgi:hypothetical protein